MDDVQNIQSVVLEKQLKGLEKEYSTSLHEGVDIPTLSHLLEQINTIKYELKQRQ